MEDAQLRKNILQYLEGHHTLSLATMGEGLPHAATVFYVSLGFNIYFVSSPASRHGLNISGQSRVSATINEDCSRWRSIKGIQMEGHVKTVGGIWENGRIALAFVKKFPDVADFFVSPPQLGEKIWDKVKETSFYELSPICIRYIDNELGFGHREELVL